jgi:PAS domain S-box-containing protein
MRYFRGVKGLVVVSDPQLQADADEVLRTLDIEPLAKTSLDELDHESFDLAIVQVPDGRTGLAAVRSLRERATGLPVLVILPEASGAESEMVGAGAADFEVLPVAKTTLAARASLLARRLGDDVDVDWHGLPLATIVESVGDVVEVNSPEVVIEYVNPAFEHIMGWKPEEAIGQTPASLFASGMHKREFFEEMERTIVSGQTWRGVLISKRKDGKLVHLDSTIAPVINEHGVVTHRVAIKRDITERLERDRKLAQSERRFSIAVQGSNEGIWDYLVDTGEMFYSERWNRIVGLEDRGLAPTLQGWHERVHADDLDAFKSAFMDHLQGRTDHFVSEHRLRHEDGSWRWALARGVAQRTGEEGVRIAGSLSDVTALKGAYQQVEAARDRAIEANRTKSLFLANMSHELRTPLNAIIGYSEMLIEDAEDDGTPDSIGDLERIKGSASHLLTLINDVLDISKIEAGKMELYLESFDVRDALKGVVNHFRPLIEKSGTGFRFEPGDGLGNMRADLTKFRQTMLNLLGNANKFTKEGQITLSARRDNNQLTFTVSDTGIGMSAEQAARLFQAFVQGDASTTRKYGGTGLGLAISQRFCQMMGGAITVESEEGKGSAFTVHLPAQVEHSAGKRGRPIRDKPLVLLIDDDEAMQELLRRTLKKRGFDTSSANDGQHGIRLAKELDPDAIVLDVMMPGMDGWTVLSELKNDPAVADIPVVMLTVVDQRELGLMLGAAEYLLKPVDSERLTTVLDRLRASQRPSPVLIVEDDADTSELFQRVLKGAGWLVEVASNGRVALETLEGGGIPDAILLDLMMPEMDGFEFLAHLRKRQEWRHIPVVVVTAKELTAEDRAMLNGSVERILQKGAYSKEELCKLVHEVVAASLSRG